MADRPEDDMEAGVDPEERERQKAEADRKKKDHRNMLARMNRQRSKDAAAGAPRPVDKAAGRGAASGAGAPRPVDNDHRNMLARRRTLEKYLDLHSDVGPGVPARYNVSRTIIPRPLSPELPHAGLQTVLEKKALLEAALQQLTLNHARRCTTSRAIVPSPPSPELQHTGLQTIMDQQPLLEMVLGHFTHENAKHLLARTSRQLAASVRDGSIPWKALTEFEFYSEDCPDVETVHGLFAQAYPFYNRDALDPYAEWLLEELCRADYGVEVKWEVIFDCIPHEEYMGDVYNPIPDDGRTPKEVTDAYKTWLAKPNRRWDVWDMKTLSDKIQRRCLDHISPTCWQSWKDPPGWCPRVESAFRWWQAKLSFNIDVDRINSDSILARLDEASFKNVRGEIDREIRKQSFTNWNQFGFALLKECHDHYRLSEGEEWHDNFRDVRDDFSRDEGSDFDDPDFDDA
jgi:hypothetical protein